MEKWHTYVLLVSKDEDDEKLLRKQTDPVTRDFRKLHAHNSAHDIEGLAIYFRTVALVVVKMDFINPKEVEIFKPLILENCERVLLFVEQGGWDEAQEGFKDCYVVRSLGELNATIEFRLGELKKV